MNTGTSGPCDRGSFSSGGGGCLACWCSGKTDSCQVALTTDLAEVTHIIFAQAADLRLAVLPPPQGIFQLVEVGRRGGGAGEEEMQEKRRCRRGGDAGACPAVQVSARARGAPRRLEASDFLQSLGAGQRLQLADVSMLAVSGTPYFSLPSSHTGNLLRSYGLHLRLTTSYTGSGPAVTAPLVLLQGGGRTLSYSPSEPLLPGSPNRVEVRLAPGRGWSGPEGPVSRAELLVMLRSVDRLLVRAQHVVAGPVDVTVEAIELEVGVAAGGSVTVGSVEQCSCPPGHTGLSCEVCAPGYSMEADQCLPQDTPCAAGRYRPEAGQGCQTCPCPLTTPSNQFATECYLDVDRQVGPTSKPVHLYGQVTCRCPPGYTGRRCGECARGFEGNPAVPGGSCTQGSYASSPGPSSSPGPALLVPVSGPMSLVQIHDTIKLHRSLMNCCDSFL